MVMGAAVKDLSEMKVSPNADLLALCEGVEEFAVSVGEKVWDDDVADSGYRVNVGRSVEPLGPSDEDFTEVVEAVSALYAHTVNSPVNDICPNNTWIGGYAHKTEDREEAINAYAGLTPPGADLARDDGMEETDMDINQYRAEFKRTMGDHFDPLA